VGVNHGLELVRLPNGVRIALDPMPGLQTTALGVWQRVGARWEAPAQNGIAHLFEHMAFKGAGGRDAKQFAEAVESVGAMINAATGYEQTSYFARVVAEHAPFVLDLIADIVLAPHWETGELEKEKGVVAQERGEAFDLPSDRVFELHQGALFPDQPLGRPILGLEETVASVDVATLAAFREQHLSPDRVVISIAGGFDRAAILDAAQRRFADLAPRPKPPLPAAHPTSGAVGETRRSEQTHLVCSWPAPSAADEAYPHRLFVEIFGGGISSRLFQDIREERGLVYSIGASDDAYEDVGRIVVSAGCAGKEAKHVGQRILDVLAALAQDGPTASELERAKAVAVAGLLMSAEAPSARADLRANQALLRDELKSMAALRACIEAVTIEEVGAAARAALDGPLCAAAIGSKTGLGALTVFQAR
jgi:predicted Zn-dependent peptidase